jgi:hypothetical protein
MTKEQQTSTPPMVVEPHITYVDAYGNLEFEDNALRPRITKVQVAQKPEQMLKFLWAGNKRRKR